MSRKWLLVASHSPQVDPIPMTWLTLGRPASDDSEIPYYSATMFDPAERTGVRCRLLGAGPKLGAHGAVAAAVQPRWETATDIAELTPHPLLTHAVEQTAHSVDVPVAALAERRDQPLPHGMLGLFADLYCAGAAVDFEVLYPSGHLSTRRCRPDSPPLLLSRDGHESPTHGGCTIFGAPLLGSHVRLHEEPERHAWEGE